MVTNMKPWQHVMIGCIIGGIILIPIVGIYIAVFAALVTFGIGLLTTGGFK